MNYSVSIRDDQIISVVDPETMDINTAHQMANDMERCAKILRDAGRPVLILVDVRPLKHDDAHTRKVMVKRTVEMDFDCLAAFGIDPVRTKMANLMLSAARLTLNRPLSGTVRIFGTQRAAERWLRDHDLTQKTFSGSAN